MTPETLKQVREALEAARKAMHPLISAVACEKVDAALLALDAEGEKDAEYENRRRARYASFGIQPPGQQDCHPGPSALQDRSSETLAFTREDVEALCEIARAAAIEGAMLRMQKEPPPGLLMSMAIRYDHGLGIPGYYDQPFWQAANNGSQKQRMESTIGIMRQLWEEVVGLGYYAPEKEADYAAMASAPSRNGRDDTTSQDGQSLPSDSLPLGVAAHSKSEYKRRIAMGDANVLKPVLKPVLKDCGFSEGFSGDGVQPSPKGGSDA